jgi:formamidopyrimidine-DNA glycosylase
MPELPEVETVLRGLQPALEGRRLVEARAFRADLRRPIPPDLEARLTGSRVTGLSRRAKYLLVELAGGLQLLLHLGMSGRIMVIEQCDAGWRPGRHDHITLLTDHGTRIVFNDARRFGLVDFIEPGAEASHPLLAGLGPEPLSNAFSGPVLAAALAGRNTSMKAALMDQRLVAGLGNIYVAEALHRAGISPRRLARNLGSRRAGRLVTAIREVLREAIQAGGSTLKDYARPDGELGYFQHHFQVYDRLGAPCPRPGCGGVIRRISQAGRSTFFCSRCQR